MIEKINQVFFHHPEIEEAILYGSRAKGNFKGGSDIDLTLKGKNLTHKILTRISLKMDELFLPYHLDLSIYSQIDNPDLLEHIKDVGLLFYKRQ